MSKPKDPALGIFDGIKDAQKRGGRIPKENNLTRVNNLSRYNKALSNTGTAPKSPSSDDAYQCGKDSDPRARWNDTPQRAIGRHCRDCVGTATELLLCNRPDCALWPYRFGFSILDKRFQVKTKRMLKSYRKEYQELQDEVRSLQKSAKNSQEKARLNIILEIISCETGSDEGGKYGAKK